MGKHSSRLGSARGSDQSIVCSVLDGTVGKCLRKPLPAFFSERESVILKNKISEDFKNHFRTKRNIFGSDCSVFSGSKLKYPFSSVDYVLIAIFSVFIIN